MLTPALVYWSPDACHLKCLCGSQNLLFSGTDVMTPSEKMFPLGKKSCNFAEHEFVRAKSQNSRVSFESDGKWGSVQLSCLITKLMYFSFWRYNNIQRFLIQDEYCVLGDVQPGILLVVVGDINYAISRLFKRSIS